MRVLAFGSFDPFHRGHSNFLTQAKDLGDYLLVVVARDAAITRSKNRQPFLAEQDRMQAVALQSQADEVILGDKHPEDYTLLRNTNFDVLVLGYDQQPSDAEAKSILHSVGKQDVRVVRLAGFKPDRYKSSFIREKSNRG